MFPSTRRIPAPNIAIEQMALVIANLHERLKAAQEHCEAINQVNGDFDARLDDAKGEIEALNQEVTRLNEDCARRARDLTTFDQMRAQAIRERDEARASYAQAFADLQAAHDASDKIIAEKDAEISQQAAQIKELLEDRARLLAELDALHNPERP
jgi:chromosome segregation ATPase